jgi:aryl-alcohol dehydrogenase-like predicted oxidoreductase
MKLGLGTVQFGLDYGISNKKGKTLAHEVKEILEVAYSNGIRVLDTAPGYGESEKVLGEQLSPSTKFNIVSKISPLDNNLSSISEKFRGSLMNLRASSIYGLLVHKASDLLGPKADFVYEKLLSLKEEKLVSKIGVSVYDGEQIDRIFGRFDLDLVQLPLNVFDQRLIASGHLKFLYQKGVEIHSRSVFLQGLLMMSPQELPVYLEGVRPVLTRFHIENERRGLSSLEAGLIFALKQSAVGTVVCGVNNKNQLKDILAANEKASSATVDESYFSDFSISDEAMINPSLWGNK